MKPILALSIFLTAVACPVAAATLEEVTHFPAQQVTGIAVSQASGRIFVNFPFWSDDHTFSVAEVMGDGTLRPYPHGAWNSKQGGLAAERFVCVQSVVIDDQDALWILDAGSPRQEGVVAGGPKLIKADLATDQVTAVIPLGTDVAPSRSYLNDVRIDTTTGHAFITESGLGAIIVVDLASGNARRFLGNHPSTKAESGVELVVDGIRPIDSRTKETPRIHADGIALDRRAGVLYFHALTSRTLYSVSTAALIDPLATDASVAKKVLMVATTEVTDGMFESGDGLVQHAAIEKNAIISVNPATGESTVLVSDPRLQWPDSMAFGPRGDLYVTTSQIHRSPRLNRGVNKMQTPYAVFRLRAE